MKKLIYTLLGAGMMVSCQTQPTTHLSGELTDMEGDSLEIVSKVLSNDKKVKTEIDTVVVKDGKFEYNFKNDSIRQVAIYEVGEAKKFRDIFFVKLPGKNVVIKGNLYNNYSYDGDEIYKAQNKLIESKLAEELKLDSLNSLIKTLYNGEFTPEIKKVYEEAKGVNLEIEEKAFVFIKKNIKTPVGLSLIKLIGQKHAVSLIDSIPEEIRNGELKPLYNELLKLQEKFIAAEKIKEGKPAPDFTLKDTEGKDFTMSSLKGKYIVLDFWGSWCGWCIKGIPDMKETYKSKKGKIEFVSIACRDTQETWRKALDEHKLPWINVIDEEGKTPTLYAINGYPTKLIINPEGMIEKIYVGETPDFYTYIKENIK